MDQFESARSLPLEGGVSIYNFFSARIREFVPT
ncbi:hypothetical protein PC116_g25170 [Phytophthora cactorum]|nr:hypothetical protein PC114_g25055 [Phytophthora cactorum]KAG4226422.1 hypothetical protein PC116_g25170 [Phytophthora cactorum]